MARSLNPSPGIFFVVRFPDGWKLEAFRCDESNDTGHVEYWTDLSRRLARTWAQHRQGDGRTACQLADLLKLDYDGFPRGRITMPVKGGKYCIFHGNNLTRTMGIARREIERAFGIEGITRWVFDEHEQCTRESRDAVRGALRITEQWRCAPDDLFD